MMVPPDTVKPFQITFLLILIALVQLVTYLSFVWEIRDYNANQRWKFYSNRFKGTDVNTKVNLQHSNIQLDRIRRIQAMCVNPQIILQSSKQRSVQKTQYYFSDSYKFALCLIPKGGSTIWTQIFGVLKYDTNHNNTWFDMSRWRVHLLKSNFIVPLSTVADNNIRTILTSRNPYTRLYSAFIDKIYVPMFGILRRQIYQFVTKGYSAVRCVDKITFEQFVRFIIHESKMGIALNRHWAPISVICQPCLVKPVMLVKIESFADDVEFALRKLDVKRDKLSTILDAMHDHRVDATIPGIVEAVFRAIEINNKRCMGRHELEKKLWHSFQIQGYLDENIRFPKEEFERQSIDSDPEVVFIKIIMKAIRQYSMSSTEAKLQRKRAVVKAYSEFSQDTIQGIQELYREDFLLFNYSINRPMLES